MRKLSEMSIEDILEKTGLIMQENDIIYICDDIEAISEFIQENGDFANTDKIKQFLIEHYDSIDKEKLILLLAKNYKANLVMIDQRMNTLKIMLGQEPSEEIFKECSFLYKQYTLQLECLSRVLKLGKGIKSFITFYYYDEEEKRNRVEVADSREVIDEKRISKKQNLRRFDKIDLYFKNGNQEEELGIEYVFQGILLTDLYRVFPTESFGNDIRTMILENAIIRKGIKTATELQKLKTLETYEEYSQLIDNVSFEGMLPEIKEVLREYCAYLDMDKLLLIAAYRFQEGLENNYIAFETQVSAKNILNGILENVKPNSQLHCELQNKRDNSYEMEQVDYTTQDLERCISQFTKTRYVKKQEIEEYRKKVQNQEMNLSEIEAECIDIIFSSQELEKLSMLSEENFIYVLEKYNWPNEKVIEKLQQRGVCSSVLIAILLDREKIGLNEVFQLYGEGVISLESLVSMKEKLVSSEETVFQKLDNYYGQTKENSNNEEIEKQYKRYIDLYKELFTKGTIEEVEEHSNQLIEKIIDGYDGQDYLQVIEEYYKNGLLTLNTVAEWNDNDIITDFYKDNLITLEDIQELVKAQKISSEYLSNIYNSFIYRDDIDYNERLKYIQSGFVKQEDIIDLYQRNLLFEKDFEDLVDKGIISQSDFQKVVDTRKKQDLEKNAPIRLIGLNSLRKKNNDIYSVGGYGDSGTERINPRCIIDPNIREEFIYMLKACSAYTDLKEDSPFYDYEFYVIPDESGGIGLNSVVIAERYYVDKMTEEKFATNNATYFFKYKDLMVLGNLKKSEMVKERDGIVFTANHTIANEKRDGHWASSVVNNLVKTMLSSNLKEYSKANQKTIIRQKLREIYTNRELVSILEKAIEIDSGEYTCEIIEPVKAKKSKGNAQPSDDNEER